MRTNELVVFDSIAQSNLPSNKKGAVLSFLERHLGSPSQLVRTHGGRALAHVQAPHQQQSMLRQHGEAVLFGGMLGMVNYFNSGLDVGTKKNIPVDLTTGLVGMLLGTWLGSKGKGIATECNNLAASAYTIFAFRKANTMWGSGLSKKKTPATKIAGEEDEVDPIISCASGL